MPGVLQLVLVSSTFWYGIGPVVAKSFSLDKADNLIRLKV